MNLERFQRYSPQLRCNNYFKVVIVVRGKPYLENGNKGRECVVGVRLIGIFAFDDGDDIATERAYKNAAEFASQRRGSSLQLFVENHIADRWKIQKQLIG